MMETRRASEDGFTVRQFTKGNVYDVTDSLGGMLINRGWAYNAEPYEDEPGESFIEQFLRELKEANEKKWGPR